MSNSGIDEFRHADDVTLYEGMAECARLGRIVAVHAENDALTSRPHGAERARLHGLAAGGRRARGDRARDRVRRGHRLRAAHRPRLQRPRRRARHRGPCAWRRRDLRDLPALPVPDRGGRRGARRRRQVRAAGPRRCGADRGSGSTCARGAVQMVTSDHSPSSPDLKAGPFGDAWGGIAGCQTTLELLLGECAPRTRAPRSRRGRRRGALRHLRQGPDRDRRRRRPRARRPRPAATRSTAEDLRYRHRISPWIGRRMGARVVRTLLRGADPSPGAGRLLTPTMRAC